MQRTDRRKPGVRRPRRSWLPGYQLVTVVVAVVVLIALADTASGIQSVEMDSDSVSLFNGIGRTVEINDRADMTLGGNGELGLLFLQLDDGRLSGWFSTSGISVGARNSGLLPGVAGRLYVNPSFGPFAALEFDAAVGELIIGSQEAEGGLTIRGSDLEDSLTVTGTEGTIANRLVGEGLVKAWARLNGDGTLVDCYRCNAVETGKSALGSYRVDFSPLAADIRSRPRTAVLDTQSDAGPVLGFIGVGDVPGKPSMIAVRTGDTSGGGVDQAFTLLVY